MNTLLELTLCGSVASVLILLLDRLFAGGIKSGSRRIWWCFLPLAFLAPVHIPMFRPLGQLQHVAELRALPQMAVSRGVAIGATAGIAWVRIAISVWATGAIAYSTFVAFQTGRVSRRWSRERLSTDHSVLEILEKCKSEANVTAPIGIVVSNSVSSPAILGWLRPRILLPEAITTASGISRLRPIILHELAHFRWCDVPFNWLLTVVRAVHWFNPLAHLGSKSWERFREEAADEAAVAWMNEETSDSYGTALVDSLRHFHGPSVPYGSLAIVESVHHLKRRLFMINRIKFKTPSALLTGAISLTLAAVICSISARAADSSSSDPNIAVTAISQSWLQEIDSGQFKQSWEDASHSFQHALTADQWIAALTKVRSPLGKCTERKQAKVEFLKDPPWGPSGTPLKGEFATVYLDSSFENLKNATETVSFEREADGSWRAAGYYIHRRI